ncbi:PA2778 family cysteine peptidase [Haliea sp. E1-2-M8]|uniref:PA2778 family cysteine peptidase n=1 Tax=Haliea sp. E1-2-M8 TaxID=3064706 RepID=UPI002716121F|nr:PA2778 family cysteine peptidase [Haliea sp. E1-2-M8]MDO8861734.1 PA2778 family cysteine peptidase [Haliea sp. E1-2-M8]
MGRSIMALALVTLLAACASTTPPPPRQAASELAAVPFFPQTAYQCGPAALATVLVHSGVATSPETLAPQVYLPDRQGSLQLELQAATRRAGRIPYTLDTSPEALLAELAAGNPVLVLQNLGLRSIPRWHYAVVVGYEPTQQRVILRSGTERRREERWSRFMASWARAGFWGLVVPPPGELPASASAEGIGPELARQEAQLEPALARAAWERALLRWPEDPDILFAAANARRMEAGPERAATLYQRLLRLAPAHQAARNNFADLLLQAGCPAAAARIIAPARAAAPGLAPPVRDAITSTAAAIASQLTDNAIDPAHCRALSEDLPKP